MYMRRLFPIVLVALIAACGEEAGTPNVAPIVIDGNVTCEIDMGQLVLDTVTVTVEDEDGAEDLQSPLMTVEATRLEVESEILEPVEPGDDPIRIRYSWVRDTGGERILCGEDGEALMVEFEVRDEAGFPTPPVFLPSTAP